MSETRRHRHIYRLLRACLHPRYRSEVWDDLCAERARITASHGRVYASAWMFVHVLRSAMASRIASPRTRHDASASDGGSMSIGPLFASAARAVARRPLYPMLAAAMLAVGIGVTSAVGMLFYAVVLRPVDARDPRMLAVFQHSLNYFSFTEVRKNALFSDSAGFMSDAQVNISSASGSRRVTPTFVTGRYFEVLGADVALGRALNERDDTRGGPLVAVVSDRLWRTALAADPAAIGQSVRVNGRAVEIVGVAGPRFRGATLTYTPDIWLPTASIAEISTGFIAHLNLFDAAEISWLQVIARLAPGVTLQHAEEEMTRRKAAAKSTRKGPELAPIDEYAVGVGDGASIRRFLLFLIGAALCGLLVTWANATSLFVSSALSHAREFAVRQALGASRRRLFAESFAATIIMAVVAGIAAVGVAAAALRTLSVFSLPGGAAVRGIALDPDWHLWTIAAGATALSALVIGLLPAWHAAQTTRLAGIDRARASARTTLRTILVSVQVAACVALVSAGTVFYRSIDRVMSRPAVLPVDTLAVASVPTTLERYSVARTNELHDAALRELTASGRGMQAVWASADPFTKRFGAPIEIDGITTNADDTPREQHAEFVGANFFHTIGAPMLKGRDLDDRDTASAPMVVVINDTLARRYFSDREALGQRIRIIKGFRGVYKLRDDWAEIVGVVPELRSRADSGGPAPALYFAYRQSPAFVGEDSMTLIVRAGAGAAAAAAIAQTLHRLAPNVAVESETLSARERDELLPQRFGMTLLGLFGIFALALSTAGILGVCSFTVSQRRREIGIRIALGAAPSDIGRVVVARIVAATLIGAAAGTMIVTAASRTLKSLTADASSTDAAAVGVAIVVALIAATAAAAMPVRRAARIDPVIVLKAE